MSIIEHVVLFKVKDDVAPSEIEGVVERINSLVSLEQPLHLTMGPLLRIQSSPSFNFTHILHSRYNSKDDLHAYAVHPTHVAVIKVNAPFIDDSMALDWVAEAQGGLVTPPGSAVRVAFFKLKEGLGDQVKDEVLGAIRGIQDEFKHAIQLTCGENFSPGRSKGFSVASLAVFPELNELEAADSNEEIGTSQKNDKIKEHLESVIVLDYVVPSP
ncbi:stress-response A/B barrel domain-containing protein UP3-like [Gastrolobium bilobum]|uniref:stress-response A/B barrel domain-containing protein UP3-like n=1 Tax=Gastrolobium bilobum TaxID=150636 RepID=UPI002AB0E3FF|nr:stress-response A/B barrel domain-containing protein UP3-like [Gastrolobium bilobum]